MPLKYKAWTSVSYNKDKWQTQCCETCLPILTKPPRTSYKCQKEEVTGRLHEMASPPAIQTSSRATRGLASIGLSCMQVGQHPREYTLIAFSDRLGTPPPCNSNHTIASDSLFSLLVTGGVTSFQKHDTQCRSQHSPESTAMRIK